MPVYRSYFKAMACDNEVVTVAATPAQAQRQMAAAVEEVLRIEGKFSRYRDDSVVSHINREAGSGTPVDCDEETTALLDFAAALFKESGGLFDITAGVLRQAWDFRTPRVPDESTLAVLLARVGFAHLQREHHTARLPFAGMEIDFGGFGKEYAADRAAQALREHGATGGYVNLGGDIAAIGPQEDGTPWQIGINDPRDLRQLIATIPLTRGGLATSGDYERYFDLDGQRYCHILNAHTGQPVHYWRSVSVLAPMCIAAGALSTIAMLKEGAGESFLQERRVTFLAVDPNGLIVNAVGGSPSAQETP
jgi:thiamine biosynthesis lipoprotein